MANTNPYTMEVAQRLKQVQNHFGYSYQKMAKVMEVADNTYYKNQNGMHLPSLRALMNLDRNLGVSMEWVLFDRAPMFWKDREQKEKKAPAKSVLTTTETGSDAMTVELKELEDLMRKIPLFRYGVLPSIH